MQSCDSFQVAVKVACDKAAFINFQLLKRELENYILKWMMGKGPNTHKTGQDRHGNGSKQWGQSSLQNSKLSTGFVLRKYSDIQIVGNMFQVFWIWKLP